MDGKLNTAKQRVFGHWELSSEPLSRCCSLLPEPLSLSHPLLHSINYHTTATLPPVFVTPLVQKGKGRRARKTKRGLGFRHLLQRGRMLITLGTKRAENVTENVEMSQGRSLGGSAWGCSTDTELAADKILVCSSSPSSSVTNASLFSRPAFPDLIRHRAHTPSQICC